MIYNAVVLAHGNFPTHPIPLKLLNETPFLVVCDGAINQLSLTNREPNVIVGDLDSFDTYLLPKYQSKIFVVENQEVNDLTKAINYCKQHGYKNIAIVGATGGREDHTMGNIALLSEHCLDFDSIDMYTDYGMFVTLSHSACLDSYPGQQISVFAMSGSPSITYKGLKYPVKDRIFGSLWEGTLNESLDDGFEIQFDKGVVLVYKVY